MQSFSVLVFIWFLFFSPAVFSQPAEYKLSRIEYIEKYKDEAVKEMLQYNIPASITLAQAMLESGNGNSPLAVYAKNHFGIKCHKGWKGPTFILDDDAKNECFRKYTEVLESYEDHSLFLKTRSWYASLFELKTTDYAGWAHGLKKAGYATNPKYAELLIQLIEDNRLYELDKIKEISKINTSPVTLTTNKPTQFNKHEIDLYNGIKAIVVKQGDTFVGLSQELDLRLWQLHKYNDLDKSVKLNKGEIIYIQPKKNKAKAEFHIVEKGETMYSISQKYGIKIKKLYQKNKIEPGTEPRPGYKLYLRKTRRD